MDIAHKARSIPTYFRDVLPILAETLRFTYAEVEMRSAGLIIQEEHSQGSVDPKFWKSITEQALVEGLAEPTTRMRIFVGRNIKAKLALISGPIGNPGRRGGVVAAIHPFEDSAGLAELLANFDALCSLASSLSESIGIEEKTESLDEVSRIRKVAAFSSETELAYAITNKLRSRDGSRQIAMAAVLGNKVKLLSVSGLDDIAPRSPGIVSLVAAMQECLDLASPVVDQAQPYQGRDATTHGRLHRQWRESVIDACVASIPLFAEGRMVAILSIQRVGKASFTPEDIQEFQEQVEPYAVGLEMVRAARRPLADHLRDDLMGFARSMLAPGKLGRKACLLMVPIICYWSFFGSLQYSITAPASLAPKDGRQVAVPGDGSLRAVHVIPGDLVKAGDLLCEFDTTELEIEAARLGAKLAASDVDIYRHLGAGDTAQAELARANSRADAASLDFVMYRISSAKVCAPIDAVVLEGDLRSRLGDTFAKGEKLFQLAESHSWKLKIRMPEKDIDLLSTGATGSFASNSRPGDKHPIEVLRISPSAEQYESTNIFVAEASCESSDLWMRPGMEGFVSIDAGEHSPIWFATHRLVDFARMHLWL